MTTNISVIQKYFTLTREKINFLFSYLIIMYAFIMPLKIGKAQELTYLLIFLWIITFELKTITSFIKQNRLFQTILLLAVLIFLSYAWSEPFNPERIWSHHIYASISQYSFRYITFFLAPMIIIVTKLKKEFIPMLIGSFLVGMFINELIAYGTFFEFWTTKRSTPDNPIAFHVNHITYSTFVGLTILLLLYKINHIKGIYIKAFYSFFIITMTISLFMSQGRTGQFSFFITSIILLLIYFRKKIKALLLSLIILATVFILAYYNMSTFHSRVNQAKQSFENIINGENVNTSLGTRIMAFDTIPYLINKENILFGVGMGDKPHYVSSTIKKEYPHRLNNFDVHGYLHNSHLEILVSNGLVGLSLYLYIFYLLFKIPIKDPFIKYIGYSLSIYYLCVGMTADIFFFRATMSAFAMFIAIIILQIQVEKKAA